MIESVQVSNFQSLQNVNIELGKFTVIVGASSSGKSAFTRALKAIADNDLGTDNITRGAKTAAVRVKTESSTVTIERTGGTSAYKVIDPSGKESSFTKLNRQVPTEVTEALGITPSTKEVESINFAGQFDTPYLLKESSAVVARILGKLTNVSTIFAAVREASKRAKNASGIVNLRKKDRDALKLQISGYANVPVELKTVSQAEQDLAECEQIDAQCSQLSTFIDKATMASQALARIIEIPELPDTAKLLEAQKNLAAFKVLLRSYALAQKQMAEQEASLMSADSAILQAEDELHQTLVSAGRCPLCSQEVKANEV